ncbi:maestro heat-like repeat-containing protein family member 1, partial [Nothoprocta perdicaria]|uniref:maestro heat-like repeat-containing protein family member 1 n=1 Tax=Nothoprocta perdicaria TaxID=30464 RepID=UPI000E1BC76F
MKSALILCYGSVALHAPKELVLARMEADILRNVFQYFNTKVLGIKVETKDLTLKLCLIRSICMISKAVCSGAKCGEFSFSRKAELVAQMVEFIKAEPLDSMRTPVRQRAMVACTYLVALEPRLSDPDRTELLNACLAGVLALPPPEPPRERDGALADGCHKEVGFSRDHRDELLEGLQALKKGLEEPDFTVLFHTCNNIATVIGKRVPPEQLMSLLLAMFDGLADPDKNCSRAATVMINSLLRERGGVLQEKVSHTCAMWRSLACEPALTSQILEQLLDKVDRDVPYKESKCFLLGSSSERVATPQPLAATCALHELMSAPECGPAVLGLYPRLFVTLLLRVSCTVGVQLPKSLQSRERRSGGGAAPAPHTLEPC